MNSDKATVMVKVLLLFVTGFCLSGCSINPAVGSAATAEAVALVSTPQRIPLTAELSESSGLVCVHDQWISFNDSGGLPVLYRIDPIGKVQHQLQLTVKNIDWEAITSDGRFLYLADTGNNAGKRTTLMIHKIPLDWRLLKQPYQPQTLEITLPQHAELKVYQHDLDFEALVFQQGALWLISKSWASQQPKMYRLDPSLKQQNLGQAFPVQSPGFLVTDASFDASTGQWWLVGYTDPRKAIWAYLSNSGFQAQIARYDKNLLLLDTKDLPTTGQVEGVCIDQNKQIWISEEGGKQKPAQLIKTGFSSQ